MFGWSRDVNILHSFRKLSSFSQIFFIVDFFITFIALDFPVAICSAIFTLPNPPVPIIFPNEYSLCISPVLYPINYPAEKFTFSRLSVLFSVFEGDANFQTTGTSRTDWVIELSIEVFRGNSVECAQPIITTDNLQKAKRLWRIFLNYIINNGTIEIWLIVIHAYKL